MRLLKRNLTEFEHLAYKGKEEVLSNGRHTGRWTVNYADPAVYRGTIGLPSGYVAKEMFGLNLDYTHVLLMDDRGAVIKVEDRIAYDGDQYEILAVRKSLNFLTIAMKILPPEMNWTRPEPEPEANAEAVDGA